jgi:hypothetical protein
MTRGGIEESPTEALDDWLRVVGYRESKTVEKLMEHIFLAEILQECWFRRRQVVEVLRAEVDAAGYDLVLEAGGVIRHVQLKASRKGARTARQTINSKLQDREGGCVVWVFYAVDELTHRAKLTYRWRDVAIEGLPDTLGRYTRRGKERPKMRLVLRGGFRPVAETSELVDLLFPPLALSA